MAQLALRTARIALVPLSDEHLEDEVALDADPEVMRHIGPPRGRHEVEQAHRRRLAAADQVDNTSTCVVQTVAADWPDLALSVVESTNADATLFYSDLMPAKAARLKGLGKAAYRLNIGSTTQHGPTIEIGWLSAAKQLQTPRFTFGKNTRPADLTAMNTKLFNLAKALDTTDG